MLCWMLGDSPMVGSLTKYQSNGGEGDSRSELG
jgi:hypothetical protein